MLFSLFSSSLLLSLNETIKINKFNKINIVWKNKKLVFVRMARYCDDKIKINEREKTRYLNTAIIDSECTISLKKDICEGPKYLFPLREFISLYF